MTRFPFSGNKKRLSRSSLGEGAPRRELIRGEDKGLARLGEPGALRSMLAAHFAETGKRLANGWPSSRPLLIDAGKTVGLGVKVRGSTA
jgi:hypothetical protein